MAVETLDVALVPAPASGPVSSRLTRWWPGCTIALVVVAGGVAKLAPLLAAVALNAFASTEETAAYYIAFTYAQALSFYCHFGVATTALAALMRAGHHPVDPGVLALRLMAAAQRAALPVVGGVAGLLLLLSGFELSRLPLLAVALLAAYGMAYVQIRMTCLLAQRADGALARYTVLVALGAYAPLLLALTMGWTRHLAAVLAVGYLLPLIIDLVRAVGRGTVGPRIPLQDCLRGGGAWTLGNSLHSLVTLLVVHHVESTLSVATVVAFGVVGQLRLGLQFVSLQVGPFVNRTVAARMHNNEAAGWRRFSSLVLVGTGTLTLLLTVPLIIDPWALRLLFSGRVPLDAAVLVGLSAASVAAIGHCLGRMLEGRQRYRAVLVSWIVFAVCYSAIVFGSPGNHLWVQAGYFAASFAQVGLLAWLVWRPLRPSPANY